MEKKYIYAHYNIQDMSYESTYKHTHISMNIYSLIHRGAISRVEKHMAWLSYEVESNEILLLFSCLILGQVFVP